MNWIIYGGIIYLCIGGCLYQSAMQENRLDGHKQSRALWLTLPVWILVFFVGRKKR